MKDKSPAFQFYPKDFLSDANVALMTTEQVGAYVLLLSYCWLEGRLPSDHNALCALARTKWERINGRVLGCFVQTDEGYIHPRLERERVNQAESRERRQAAAERRWRADALHVQSNSNADAKQCSSSPSPSSSPSASSTALVQAFDLFWNAYPRKTAKGAARKSFEKALKATTLDVILAALEAQAGAFAKDGGKFIPHPATWLNQERWLDETAAPEVEREKWWQECERVGHSPRCANLQWHEVQMAKQGAA